MPRIFNTIRHRLLKENRLTRYLVYAIGEIFLVMIGILLALQVNLWNLARLDRQKEVKYLQTLKLDLLVDLENLDDMIIERNRKVTSAIALLKHAPPTNIQGLLQVDSMLWNVYIWRNYIPRTNALKELTNSGDLNIIRDDSIRTLLLRIEERNALLVTSTAHMEREYHEYLYDRTAGIREYAPFQDLDESTRMGRAVNDTLVSPQRGRELLAQTTAILSDLTIRNGLKLARGNNVYIRRQYEAIVADTKRLIGFIDADLNTLPNDPLLPNHTPKPAGPGPRHTLLHLCHRRDRAGGDRDLDRLADQQLERESEKGDSGEVNANGTEGQSTCRYQGLSTGLAIV
ncbi:MAG: hypothetical protein IPL52_09030 [Flavobacteriales bacterium]|nr:hypothetical protein [Flavobacteriales bacterium]